MPLYEYSCPVCHERFELLQRMGESGESVRCPSCSAGGAERRLSTFAAAVRGSSGASFEGAGCARPQCGAGAGFT